MSHFVQILQRQVLLVCENCVASMCASRVYVIMQMWLRSKWGASDTLFVINITFLMCLECISLDINFVISEF